MMVLPLTQPTAGEAYAELKIAASNVRSYFVQIRDDITAGNAVSLSFILSAIAASTALLTTAQTLMANQALADAVGALVRTENAQPDLDTTASMTASMTALGAAVAAMVADYPRDAAGHPLDRILNADGTLTAVSAQAASLAGSATAIESWLATIS